LRPRFEISLDCRLEVVEVDIDVEGDVASRSGIVAEALFGLLHVPLEGAFFDLTTRAEPQRLMRVVLLRDHLEAEAQRGVADLLAAQNLEAAVDVFACDRRLDLLEAQEVLVVQVAQAVDAGLELAHEDLNVLRFQRHGGGTPRS
jgi:intracellular sulfur oxidation DsrE/DsrF family protein